MTASATVEVEAGPEAVRDGVNLEEGGLSGVECGEVRATERGEGEACAGRALAWSRINDMALTRLAWGLLGEDSSREKQRQEHVPRGLVEEARWLHVSCHVTLNNKKN